MGFDPTASKREDIKKLKVNKKSKAKHDFLGQTSTLTERWIPIWRATLPQQDPLFCAVGHQEQHVAPRGNTSYALLS